MLLESDGTVLVHNEPDNNTTGGTNNWWKLTPDSNGNYVGWDVEPDRVDAGGVHARCISARRSCLTGG